MPVFRLCCCYVMQLGAIVTGPFGLGYNLVDTRRCKHILARSSLARLHLLSRDTAFQYIMVQGSFISNEKSLEYPETFDAYKFKSLCLYLKFTLRLLQMLLNSLLHCSLFAAGVVTGPNSRRGTSLGFREGCHTCSYLTQRTMRHPIMTLLM